MTDIGLRLKNDLDLIANKKPPGNATNQISNI